MLQRLVLVHGSVFGAGPTWSRQQPLAASFELVLVERAGFSPRPPVESVDFELEARDVAALLRTGDHLVDHSYGGVIALLAAGLRVRDVASLTVIEPPAMGLAPGDAAVEELVSAGEALWRTGPRDDPEAFLRRFLAYVGSGFDPPSPLPAELEQGARTLIVERPPWEAEIPLAALAAAQLPMLAVSGGHAPAFEAVCDVLAERLGAERAVLPGYGHAAQRHPAFNGVLASFVARAAGAGATPMGEEQA